MFAMASVSWCQPKTFVKNKSYTLTKFLAVLATKFDVKYSYADELMVMERITIQSKNNNLLLIRNLVSGFRLVIQIKPTNERWIQDLNATNGLLGDDQKY